MKLIAVYTKGNSSEENDGSGMLVWPDSAFIRTGKPLFVPDGEGWNVFVAPCLRIDRLGKTISRKFASRYYREIAPMAVVVPKRAAAALETGSDPLATDIVADCSIVCGDFLSMEDYENLSNIEMTVTSRNLDSQEEMKFTVSLDDFREKAADAINYVSQRNTLKTGDIVATALPQESFPAEYNLVVSAEIDKKELLKFKIK